MVMAGKDVIVVEVDKGVGEKGDHDRSNRVRLAGQGSEALIASTSSTLISFLGKSHKSSSTSHTSTTVVLSSLSPSSKSM